MLLWNLFKYWPSWNFRIFFPQRALSSRSGLGHNNGGIVNALLGGGGPTQEEEEDLEQAAVFLVLEWVEKLFSVKMSGVQELARYLIDKMYVDNSSAAAQTVNNTSSKYADIVVF